MTSNLLRKVVIAGACVAALGLVACKPKPAADAAASDAASAEAAASDAAAAASDAMASASDAAASAVAASQVSLSRPKRLKGSPSGGPFFVSPKALLGGRRQESDALASKGPPK